MFLRAGIIFSGEIADRTKNREARATSLWGMESLNLSTVKSHTNALHLSAEYEE
jgi:hypothetical protein